jgi:hypothetical protein
MTTHVSEIAGARNSLPPCSGCESLDALGREMFEAPGLLELERTLERHPHYPLLKLKENLARRPTFVLGLSGESLESAGGLYDSVWAAASTHGDGRRANHLGATTTESRLWGGGEGRRAATGVACQKRSRGSTICGSSRTGAELPAAAPQPNVVVDDCEELMILLANRNPDVPKMSAREIEKVMIEVFGKENSFTYRTIQETTLYKMWRKELKKARHDVDIDDLGDALDTGLAIASHKHGCSDRRKDYSPAQEATIRDWKKGIQNATAQAGHRVEDRKRGR